MAFGYVPHSAQTREQRQVPRFDITLPILLHHAGKKYPATIENICEGGLKVSSTLLCSAGEAVVVCCSSGEVPAKVAWQDGSSLGLTFAQPIRAADVASHLERSGAIAKRRACRRR